MHEIIDNKPHGRFIIYAQNSLSVHLQAPVRPATWQAYKQSKFTIAES